MVSQLALLLGAAVPDFDDRADDFEPDSDLEDDPELPVIAPGLPFDSDAPLDSDVPFDAEPVDPELSEDPADFDPASPELDAVSFAASVAGLSPDLSADEPAGSPARLSFR